jgi:hypothetical protein
MVDTPTGRSQCPLDAAWAGWLHAARAIYLVETCDRHKSGLVDAEPLDGNWERSMAQTSIRRPGSDA